MSYAKTAIPEATRRAVATRYGCQPGQTLRDVRCYWCPAIGSIVWHRLSDGRPSMWVTFPSLELDHLHPEALGGGHEPENIVLACRRCNRSRGSRHPHVPLSEFGAPNSSDDQCRKGREGKGTRKGHLQAQSSRLTSAPDAFGDWTW